VKLLRDFGLHIVLTLAMPVVIFAIYAGYSMLGDPWGDLVLGAATLTIGAILLYYMVLAANLGISVFRLSRAAKNAGPKHG
jgi:hypothetical protein